MQWSWLRNEHSHFQLYYFLHSFMLCENLSCHWWEGCFFNSVWCYKVPVKIKKYKGILQYNKNQTIKSQRFDLTMHWFCWVECLKCPNTQINFLFQQRKWRYTRWKNVVKTDEDFSSIRGFNQHNFMNEMINKVSQPTPNSGKIRVWLLETPSYYQWKRRHFSLKHSFLMGGFENICVKINMPFCDNIGRWFYLLEYALPCWYISNINF